MLTLNLGSGQVTILMSEATLSIGEVAGKAGVSVSAIRYYEHQGLLPEPERVGGQRRYTDAVRRAKDAGVPVALATTAPTVLIASGRCTSADPDLTYGFLRHHRCR